jgi:hypothetical protein
VFEFQKFRIESLQDNKIGFEIDSKNFQLALKFSDPGQSTAVKLKKKNGQTFLSFEITTQVIFSTKAIRINQNITSAF